MAYFLPTISPIKKIHLLEVIIIKIPCGRLINTAITMIYTIEFRVPDSSIFPNLLTFLHLFMEGREWIVDLKEMIGSRIQEIRNKKGLTQDQLSEKVGISSKYLSSIERGK